ncbi:MAG: DUF2953 domain-containing protein [Clostridia bacterium]|nr:DUF2953 domain-containing protein [Clostridia bacterium]
MIALYILGGILLFTVLLCLLPVGIRIKYDNDFSLFVSIGFINIRVIPAKQKKIRVSDYSERKLERQRKRQQKKDAEKERKNTAGTKKEKKDSVLAARLKNLDTAPDMIEQLYDMLSFVSDKFAKRLTVRFFQLDAIIGSDNAAKTAIIYGGACSAAGCISAFLDQHMSLKKRNEASIRITPDFLSEKTVVYADVSMTVRVGGIFTFIFEIRNVISEIYKLLQEDNSNG